MFTAFSTLLLAEYEENIATAPQGKMFQECYDLKTAQPTSWYEDMFGEVKKKVAAMGVDFVY